METTSSQATTVRVETTTVPTEVTTAPTISTSVVETTTSLPVITSTSPETTLVVETATTPQTTIVTKPSVLNTTATVSTVTGSTTEATTVIGPVTQTLPGTALIYSTGATTTGPIRTTVVSTLSLLTTTTVCVCTVNGTTHLPGDLVYNVTDGLGWCYVAYCNASCQVDVQSSPCPTTSIPSTTSTTISTSTIPSTTTLDCNDEYPHRKNGESWKVDNCTTATCFNGYVGETSIQCPQVQQPICVNGHSPVKVYDDDGCCFQYECGCKCTGYGSRYTTFDGKSYTFNESCSYYLVKEIIFEHNLTITVNKQDCDPLDSTFCPQSLTVLYGSYKVVLTQLRTSGNVANVVYVNEKRIYPAWSNSVLHLTSTNVMITLEIAEINTTVVYRGSSFIITIPYSLFNGNTEGQCGTCDSSQTNDCRSPNGQVESCSESAGQWQVPGTPCVPTTTPPTTTTATARTTSRPSSSTTGQVCKPAICDLLTSSVFEPCHTVISPGQFVATCQSDNCNGGNDTCSSLEAYATECSNAGVCIDWRNATNGQCELTCPNNKVYMACGPTVEPTCNPSYNEKFKAGRGGSTNNTKEGCFCPNGTTLFNTIHDTCVTACECVGPDGKPKQIGETWTSDCYTCVCDEDSMSTQCLPVECPTEPSPNCSEPGLQLVNKTEGCCTVQSCECNVDLCPAPISCPLGFQLNVTKSNCCQSYECVPKGVCVYDMTEYEPGSKIPTPEPPTEPPLDRPPIPGTTTAPPGTGRPSGTTTGPSGAGQPSGTTTAPSGSGQPSGTTTGPSGTGQPSVTTTGPSGAGQPSGTTTAQSGAGQPSGTTTSPSGAGQPSGTTTGPSGAGQPSGTTPLPSGTQSPIRTTTPYVSDESFKPGPCQECYCGPRMDPITKLNIITCTPVVCNTNCSKGYEYQTVPGKCCGKCVRKSCILTAPDNTTHVIAVNETYTPPNDKCVQYTCQNINGELVTKETKTTCPPFNPLDCEPGTETTDANGCCKTCKLRSVCEVKSNETVIEVSGCKSTQPVNMTYCAGHCGSSSMYSAAANMMMHQCECCQEATTSQRQVELTCQNGSKRQHTYTMVETCSCSRTECVAGTTPRQQRRRRR